MGTHAHHPLLHLRLFEQLKQRNVFRVAALYLVVCWLILDPVHVVFHMLDVPIWADRLVIMLMVIGFPAALIFAWVYEITPEGLKPTVEVPHGQSIRRLTGRRIDRAIIAVLLAALGYLVIDKFWISRRPGPSPPVASATTGESRPSASTSPTAAPVTAAPEPASQSTVFDPPQHSIAVLPFVNMSGDKQQEYFSDGLTEELLNSLSRINELQVAGRTSSFYFKGEHADLSTIAHKLNVASVLEGSVRRSAHTVRITAQLINAANGFHLWSQTYDRDLGDVLKLQTEIADAVAGALKVTLLGDVAARIELGGTHNAAAFDAYLRASKAVLRHDAKSFEAAISAYTEAARLDPNYALAFAQRSLILTGYASEFQTDPAAIRESIEKARADATQAIALAPGLAEGHLALGAVFDTGLLDFTQATTEYERALALAPGHAQVLAVYGRFAVYMGRTDTGLATARRAVVVDPLNPITHSHLGQALFGARRYEEAIAAFQDFRTLDPEDPGVNGLPGLAYYALGNLEAAKTACEVKLDYWISQQCLAMADQKLGRRAEAEAAVAKLKATYGEAVAFQYAEIYAQWGETSKALEWLETAFRLRDPGLLELRSTPLLDPLRNEPRFQAIERQLKFPTR